MARTRAELLAIHIMYIPKHFEEPSVEVMHELIRARPLATVVTFDSLGLNANHIPLHLSGEPAPLGTLRGHVARSNKIQSDVEALAIFHGPDAYISPSWYATKKENGKVVPTWNYVAVHAYGSLRLIDDASWVRTQLEILTQQNEKNLPKPWAVSDAPHEYTEKLIEMVVGIEIVITKLSGKWKVSQNQPAQNQASVIKGLENLGLPDSNAIAELVRERGNE
jgi:transcriptional regulator